MMLQRQVGTMKKAKGSEVKKKKKIKFTFTMGKEKEKWCSRKTEVYIFWLLSIRREKQIQKPKQIQKTIGELHLVMLVDPS